MQYAGIKRGATVKPWSTIVPQSKRRKPLCDTTGNSASRHPTPDDDVAPKTIPSQPLSPRVSNPPATSPHTTDALWAEVRTNRTLPASRSQFPHKMPPKETQPTRGMSRTTRAQTRSGKAQESKASSSDIAMDEVEDSTTVTTSISRTTGPHQARFRTLVLDPRGIKLYDHKPKAKPPAAHFITAGAADNRRPELSHLGILLSLDDSSREGIRKHYSFLEKMRLSEDQFASSAKQVFFKCEEWELDLPHDRLWRGERVDTFVNPANPEERWLPPPLLTQQSGADGYRWDVRPDCAYWLSNRGFNEEYADSVPGCCFVYRNWISNPYLTIEFKKNDWKPGVAATQLLTAAAIALYNRCILASHARRAAHEADDLRHYGITFEGPHFVVYVVTPNLAEHPLVGDNPAGVFWRGCEMRRLAQGDCTDRHGVERLSAWINAIHQWGITNHAQSVQTDIKACLQEEGIEVSAVY